MPLALAWGPPCIFAGQGTFLRWVDTPVAEYRVIVPSSGKMPVAHVPVGTR